MRRILFFIVAVFTASCGAPQQTADTPDRQAARPPGATEALRATLEGYDGLELIVTDLVIPPDGVAPRHFHPGEELVYVIEGSAVHVEDGQPERTLTAGDAVVIAPGAIHAPRGGPEGARAILVHVVPAGEEARVLAGGEGQ